MNNTDRMVLNFPLKEVEEYLMKKNFSDAEIYDLLKFQIWKEDPNGVSREISRDKIETDCFKLFDEVLEYKPKGQLSDPVRKYDLLIGLLEFVNSKITAFKIKESSTLKEYLEQSKSCIELLNRQMMNVNHSVNVSTPLRERYIDLLENPVKNFLENIYKKELYGLPAVSHIALSYSRNSARAAYYAIMDSIVENILKELKQKLEAVLK